MIEIDREAVRGELPDVVFDAVEWERFAWLTAAAIEKQESGVREDVKEHFAEIRFEVSPFDEKWMTVIRMNGLPLLHLHVSSLLKFAPLELDRLQMPERLEGDNPGGYL